MESALEKAKVAIESLEGEGTGDQEATPAEGTSSMTHEQAKKLLEDSMSEIKELVKEQEEYKNMKQQYIEKLTQFMSSQQKNTETLSIYILLNLIVQCQKM